MIVINLEGQLVVNPSAVVFPKWYVFQGIFELEIIAYYQMQDVRILPARG